MFHICKICPIIIHFLETITKSWQTLLVSPGNKENNQIPVKILRGTFQGHALSPLWLRLVLTPLTTASMKAHEDYALKTNEGEVEITGRMYMDKMKEYSSTAKGVKRMLRITEQYSNDIQMSF